MSTLDNGPDGDALDTRPPWCGTCDQRTRLHERADGRLERCPHCHPTPSRQLSQYARCGGCRTTIYRWDSNRCEDHIPVGEQMPIAVKGEIITEKEPG